MKKNFLLLFLLTFFTAGLCMASDFSVGTLNYTIITGTTNVQVDGLVNTSATSVVIPAKVTNGSTTYNVTAIANSAFSSKTSLTTVDMSAATNLETIGTTAFAASNLSSIKIPAKLKTIGDQVFWFCSNLQTVDLSGATALESIGANAFNSCSSLKSIAIPAKVTSIGASAFFGCTGLQTVDLTKATSLQTIAKGAFKNCNNTSFTSITIPANVTYLGDMTISDGGAFYGCSNLISVTLLPATIKNWFQSNSGIKNVIIGSGVTTIDTNAFYNCTGLTSVDLTTATSLQTIGANAFYGCNNTNFKSITIPASVTSIESTAFGNCSNLTSVTLLPATIKNWFQGNSVIKNVAIGSGVKTIDAYAFKGCTGLQTVDLTKATSLQTIGANAFYGCNNTNFKSITIPASVTSIESTAFDNCSNLTSVTLLPATIKNWFQGNSVIKNVAIGSGVTTIGTSAFRYCTDLQTVDLTKATALQTIGTSAFLGCANTSFTSIKIPASVTNIYEYAFQDCTNLSSVYMENTTPPTLGSSSFYGCSSDLKIYVKDGKYSYESGADNSGTSTNAYKTATGWKSYDSKIYPYFKKSIASDIGYATLALPYAVNIPTGLTAYYGSAYTATSGTTKDNMTLTPITTAIPANTACLLKGAAGEYSFFSTTSAPAAITGNKLSGAIDAKTVASDAVMTLGKEKTSGAVGFYKYTGTTIPANTCYIDKSNWPNAITAPSKGIFFSFGGENTTGIDHPAIGENTGEKIIYDLMGRRVKNPQKGIYIVNGKKVIY